MEILPASLLTLHTHFHCMKDNTANKSPSFPWLLCEEEHSGWLARPHLHSPISSVEFASFPVAPHHKNHLELGSARGFASVERLSADVTVSSSRGGQNPGSDGEE